jgi:hypothetical protein
MSTKELHTHLDIFPQLSEAELQKLEDLFQEIQLPVYSHHFDHALLGEPILKKLHGVEPEQHYSIRKENCTSFMEIRRLAKTMLDLANASVEARLPPNQLYSEYETVSSNNLPPNITPKLKDSPLFVSSKEIVEIDWSSREEPLYEIHVPVELETLRRDANMWLETGFNGVSRMKDDGNQYVILTGLSADRNLFQNLFQFLTQEEYRAVIECKYYMTNEGMKTHNLIKDVQF